MTPDNTPLDSVLERAISEIRGEDVADEVVDAAAARVWARLQDEAASRPHHIATCAEFQALIPAFRAGSLSPERRLLLEDHLHACVACRRVASMQPSGADGVRPAAAAVIPMPPPRKPARYPAGYYWTVAAGVAAAGVVWFAVMQFSVAPGRAIVQSVNGTLYEVSASGLRVMATGEPLPDGMEVRTGRDSGAMLKLADGSVIEMGERADFSTTRTSGDTTVHLDRGNIIVQAAKRRSGHLYVATADCRVAVTGTVFSVSSGLKGSRVSVMEGEVHLSYENREQVLHPGDQASTSDTLEPVSVPQDMSWSRNTSLQHQLAALRDKLDRLHLPQARHQSHLLDLLPASTMFFASVPNLAQYLREAEDILRKQAAESPELHGWLASQGVAVVPVLETLRTANEYLGDEIAVFGTPETAAPVFLAESKRPGFAEFLRKAGLPLAVEERSGLVLFSPRKEALTVALDKAFPQTPFYTRIAAEYRDGAGLLVAADLSRIAAQHAPSGMRYLVAEQKEVGGQLETRASVGLDGSHAGVSAWLAAPSPMGSLDYVSSDATFVSAFTVTRPAAMLDQMPALGPHAEGVDLLKQAASQLGGEFVLALDGPPFPVPSWKLVAEVYDPAGFQAALAKFVAEFDREAPSLGRKPLRTAEETAAGRTYYEIAGGDPNPLTEVHYTFSSGYLIAAPTRALLTRALEVKATGAGIARSPGFVALVPRDPHANFSAVVYQNLGTTLAPFAGLLGSRAAEGVAHLKPTLITAYAAPDQIALSSRGDLLGMKLNSFLSGSVLGMAGDAIPLAQILGTVGTNRPKVPSR